jgi:Fur family transcriptional regulator, ferric uptake regulator
MDEQVPGQRQTRQRDAILSVLYAAAGPLTVEEVHGRGQEHVIGLGIATVYRTIRLLLESGQVQSVTLPTGETRYETSARGHHHHFLCRICDTVYDFDECPVSASYEQALPAGFTVEDHEITLFGTCSNCRTT